MTTKQTTRKTPAKKTGARKTPQPKLTVEQRLSALEAQMGQIVAMMEAAKTQRQQALAARLAQNPGKLAELKALVDAAENGIAG